MMDLLTTAFALDLRILGRRGAAVREMAKAGKSGSPRTKAVIDHGAMRGSSTPRGPHSITNGYGNNGSSALADEDSGVLPGWTE